MLNKIDFDNKINSANLLSKNKKLTNFNIDDLREVEQLEDGSSVYEIGPPVTHSPEEDEGDFYKNLANHKSDEELKKMAVFLLDSIGQDIEANEKWMQSINKVKPYLGFDVEDITNEDFKGATKTFDTTLATAIIRYLATASPEFLPPDGPCGYVINGESTPHKEDKGDRVKRFLNNYFVRGDKGFYPDFKRFLFHLGFNGSACRKIYYDKFLNLPISRFIRMEDFIIDADCNSIEDSGRITHILHLSKREILLNQQRGIYRDVELPYLKTGEASDEVIDKIGQKNKDDVDLSGYEKRSLFPIYECHVDLNLDDFRQDGNTDEKSIPLPYIIIIDPTSKQILSIRRNWREDDPLQKKINYFVLYDFFTGLGIRGLGLAHLMGTNAITLTTLIRVLTDAGKFQNLPGGMRKKGAKQQQNNITVGPGEWVTVDTGGEDLDKMFMPLPYGGPSQSLFELYKFQRETTKDIGAASELGMMSSKEDIATGTAMAFLETANRIPSAVLKSIHDSFNQELQLIYNMFKDTLSDDFSEYVNGEEVTIDDFIDELEIIPVSDPSMNSSYQKAMKADMVVQSALQAPDIHNMREVYVYNYKSKGIVDQEIEKLLLPVQKEEEVLPLDPASEDMNMMLGKPVKTAKWQNHPAHNIVHGLTAEKYPELAPTIFAHMREHDAQERLLEMERILGHELPPLEQLMDPEIQNAIALQLAQSIPDNNSAEPAIDPKQELILADIRQKEAENVIRERIANLKAETDIFKAQLDFEKEKAKIESAEDIAKLRAETELIKQEVIDE